MLLTTCVLMAAPAKEEDPAARAQATLQQVSKLPLDHQHVWLRLIEQRYGWAVLLTLKPEDAKHEQARVAKILHQKTVGWNELIDVLRQLDQRERQPSPGWCGNTARRSMRHSARDRATWSIGRRPGTASGRCGKRPAVHPSSKAG